MQSRFSSPLLAALAMIAAASAANFAHAQKVLRWKFTDGQKLAIQFNQEMNTAATVQGNEVKTSMKMGMDMSWAVKSVSAAGVATMTQAIDRIQFDMQIPFLGNVKYDSQDKGEPTGVAAQIAKNVKPLIGATFTQEMSPRGEILDVKIDEATKKALEQGAAKALLKQFASEEGLKSLMGQSATVFPEKSVSKGDTWNNEFTTDSQVGKLKVKIEYTYQGSETRGDAEVEKIDMKINMDFQGGALGPQFKVQQQNNQGTIYFDNQQGRLVESTATQDMTLKATIQGQEISQKITGSMKMTVK